MSSASGEACGFADEAQQTATAITATTTVKKKRNLPGTPDPHAEVIALSPKTLMATNRFSCEVCGKGFQRDQNLQLHRRGHNLPWKLKQREGQEVRKKVYVCPESTCVHHDPSRALGDLTGIKKHFSRKHGEKKWKCDKCSKKYAVHSDWKAHQKVCGTREYRCDCGTLFSRRDSFITHRAFCDALAEESARVTAHKQVESQQSGGHEEQATPVQTSESTKPAEASDSPHPLPTGRPPDVEASEASTTDALRPESCSVDARCVSPLTNKWIQDGKAMKSKPSKGPALSLSLGTGPGPGPPGALQMGCSPRNDARPPTFADVTKVESLIQSEIDERMKWSDVSDGMGSFTSMLTSGNSDTDAPGYDIEHHGSSHMAGISVCGSSFIASSSMPRFTLPPPRSILPDNSFGNGYMPPKPSHHTGSGQLPATALLQKAAMMGATATNPYFYRNYGSSTLSAGYGQDSWAGPSVSNAWAGYSSMHFAGSARSLDQGHGHAYGGDGAGSPHPIMYGGQGGVQAFMNSFCGGRTSMFKSASIEPSYGSARASMSDVVGGGPKLQESTTHPVTVGLRGDGHESSRTTLDFLGIGGHNSSGDGVIGVTMTGNNISSERTIGGVNTSGVHIKMEPVSYDGNMKGKGIDRPPPRE